MTVIKMRSAASQHIRIRPALEEVMSTDEHQRLAQEWINENVTPGRWLDIQPTEVIPEFILGWPRTIAHMFQMSFTPEIKKRLIDGKLSSDFSLNAAQMVQPIEGGTVVRLNDEVKGVAQIISPRPVEKGDDVYHEDLKELKAFDLLEEEIDNGHFTIFWVGHGWAGAFDFRSGRSLCLKLLDAARQFFESAQDSAAKGHERPCIDNLFSCCELISKVKLQLTRNNAAKSKTHSTVKSEINRWGKLGNVDGNFLQLFNRLSQDRFTARYDVTGAWVIPSRTDFEMVNDEIEASIIACQHLFADEPK